ncbi:TATA-binding protein-associated factor [Pseudoscourfieldia marina]
MPPRGKKQQSEGSTAGGATRLSHLITTVTQDPSASLVSGRSRAAASTHSAAVASRLRQSRYVAAKTLAALCADSPLLARRTIKKLVKANGVISNEWTVRLATSSCFGEIARQLPVPPESTRVEGDSSYTGYLSIANFDVQKVALKGKPLLASTGEEYDTKRRRGNADGSKEERLAAARDLMLEKMGLKDVPQIVKADEIFTEHDITADGSAAAKREAGDTDVVSLVDSMAGGGGEGKKLSARERIMLKKRKRMEASGVAPVKGADHAKEDGASDDDDDDDDDGGDVKADYEWPLKDLCDLLITEYLLSPKWETRHGATAALRDIMLASTAKQVRNTPWMLDLACRLLSVLALDRFGDFESDDTVAPVRDTAAQALAAVVCQLDTSDALAVLDRLDALRTCDAPAWEVRHGALLGMRYCTIARREAGCHALLAREVACSRASLGDADDDVRSAAASAFAPHAEWLVETNRADAHAAFSSLLTSTMPSMNIACGSVAPVVELTERLARALGNTKHTAADSLPPRSAAAAALWPFVEHPSARVRTLAGRALAAAWTASPPGGDSSDAADAARILMQRALCEPSADARKALEGAFDAIIGDAAHMLAADDQMPAAFLRLGATKDGHSVEASRLLRASKTIADAPATEAPSGHAATTIQAAAYAVSSNISVAFAQRKSFCSMGGKLLATLSADASCSASVQRWVQILRMPFDTRSAHMRQTTSLLLLAWCAGCSARTTHPRTSLTPSDFAGLLDVVEANLVTAATNAEMPLRGHGTVVDPSTTQRDVAQHFLPYSELDSLLNVTRKQARVALASAMAAGLSDPRGTAPSPNRPPIAHDPAFVAAFDASSSSPEARATATRGAIAAIGALSDSLCASLAASTHASTSANSGDTLNMQVSRLKDSSDRLRANNKQVSLSKRLHVTTAALNAAAAIALRVGMTNSPPQPPDKVTAYMKVLMPCVREETVLDVQKFASEGVTAVIASQPPTQTPVLPKLLGNVCAYAIAEAAWAPALGAPRQLALEESLATATKALPSSDQKDDQGRQLADGEATRRGASCLARALCNGLPPGRLAETPELWQALTCTGDDGDITRKALASGRTWLPHLLSMPANDPAQQRALAQVLPEHVSCLASIDGGIAAGSLLCTLTCCVDAKALAPACRVFLSLLNDVAASAVPGRSGAAYVISGLATTLSREAAGLAPLVLRSLLSLSSSKHAEARAAASLALAELMPLLPVAAYGFDSAPTFLCDCGSDSALATRWESERAFVCSLIDNARGGASDRAISAPLLAEAEGGVNLRPYQREGVAWLAFLRNAGLHGILADDMGLGKTLQTLIAVAEASLECTSRSESPPPSLVVCPATLVFHWAAEAERHFATSGNPLLPVVSYVGTPAAREKMRASPEWKEARLVVMSYETLRSDIERLSGMSFLYCICDEGHVLRNPSSGVSQASRRIDARHRLVLSGTPVQNHPTELWSLFAFAMPGYLGELADFKASYGKAVDAARGALGRSRANDGPEDPEAAQRNSSSAAAAAEANATRMADALGQLRKRTNPFVLRRTKESVLKDLPPKTIEDVYVSPTPVMRAMHETVKARISASHDGDASEKAAPVLTGLSMLRALCTSPSIAYDARDAGHVEALRRCGLSPSDLGRIQDAEGCKKMLEHAPKIEALATLLSSVTDVEVNGDEVAVPEGGRQRQVLVFAQFRKTLDLVERLLLDSTTGLFRGALSHLRLDGSMNPTERSRAVKRFTGDPSISLLLLTTKVGGLGLNLTCADTVIFLEHDYNPMADLQAMDRAHRLGQKRAVSVYRLLVQDTLEVELMGLQSFKKSVAAKLVVSGGTDKMDTSGVLSAAAEHGESLAALQASHVSDEAAAADEAAAGAGLGKAARDAMAHLANSMGDEDPYADELDEGGFVKKLKGDGLQ